MSKTSQRIQSIRHNSKVMYQSGFSDAISGYGFRWRRHPNMSQYRLGYEKGMERRKPVGSAKEAKYSKNYLYWITVLTLGAVCWGAVIYQAISNGWV